MMLPFAVAALLFAQAGAKLGQHDDEVLCLAFSPDGKTLASGSADGTVKTWNLTTRTNIKDRYLSGGATQCLAYTPDGKDLAIGKESSRAMMVDVEEFDGWKYLDGFEKGPVRTVAVSPDSAKVYIIADKDKRLYVWQPKGKNALEKHEHESEVLAFALSADGKTMATAVGSGKVRVFSTQSVERLQQVDYEGSPICLAFSRDGKRLACGGSGGVRLWDVGTGKPVTGFKAAAGAVSCIAFAPNGASLAVGTEAGPILLLDARTGAQSAKLEGHGKAVTGVGFASDGKTLASTSRDKTVWLWPMK